MRERIDTTFRRDLEERLRDLRRASRGSGDLFRFLLQLTAESAYRVRERCREEQRLPRLRCVLDDRAALHFEVGAEHAVGFIEHQHLEVGELERGGRSEEHTSELQSLMRISYAVFCLQKKTTSK